MYSNTCAFKFGVQISSNSVFWDFPADRMSTFARSPISSRRSGVPNVGRFTIAGLRRFNSIRWIVITCEDRFSGHTMRLDNDRHSTSLTAARCAVLLAGKCSASSSWNRFDLKLQLLKEPLLITTHSNRRTIFWAHRSCPVLQSKARRLPRLIFRCFGDFRAYGGSGRIRLNRQNQWRELRT